MMLPILNCDDCGVCCMHMATPPYLSEEEEASLPDHVRADLAAVRETRALQFKRFRTDSVPCGFFDWVTRGCRHHEHRPQVCRDFNRGGHDCRRHRREAGIKNKKPAGRG